MYKVKHNTLKLCFLSYVFMRNIKIKVFWKMPTYLTAVVFTMTQVYTLKQISQAKSNIKICDPNSSFYFNVFIVFSALTKCCGTCSDSSGGIYRLTSALL